MPIHVQPIYMSSNGDRWLLVRDTSSALAVVRHEANQSSGGQITEQTVERFLAVNGPGPEFAALRRLLEEGEADVADG